MIGGGYFLATILQTKSMTATMSNPNVKTSFVLIRPPPFGVDRPPSDSPIISSLSNLVNIPQQKTKPLDAQRASWYNLCYKGGVHGSGRFPLYVLELEKNRLIFMGWLFLQCQIENTKDNRGQQSKKHQHFRQCHSGHLPSFRGWGYNRATLIACTYYTMLVENCKYHGKTKNEAP